MLIEGWMYSLYRIAFPDIERLPASSRRRRRPSHTLILDTRQLDVLILLTI